MAEPRKHEKYNALIYACHGLAPVRTAVAHPCDETSLSGAVEAAAAKIIKPVLVGPEARIRKLAASLGLDLAGLQLIDAPHSHAAAEKAVEIVRAGAADALMKGSLHTDELLAESCARIVASARHGGSVMSSSWTCQPTRNRFSSPTPR